MNIIINDGFNLVYAKKCGRPNNRLFHNRIDLINFLVYNIEDIDFMSINDVIINKEKLIKDNILLSRYLKINKINKII